MKLILVACVLLASFGSISAASCYSCSYVPNLTGNECKDPFDAPASNSTGSTCEDGTYCMKATSSLNGETTSITRSCGAQCEEMCASLFGIEACTYCCQGDLCNGAGSVTFGLLTTVATVVASLKLTA